MVNTSVLTHSGQSTYLSTSLNRPPKNEPWKTQSSQQNCPTRSALVFPVLQPNSQLHVCLNQCSKLQGQVIRVVKLSYQVHVQLNQSTNLQVQAWLQNKFNFDFSHKTNKHIKTWIGVSARRTCQCSLVLQWHLRVQQDHHLESHYLKWHELIQA